MSAFLRYSRGLVVVTLLVFSWTIVFPTLVAAQEGNPPKENYAAVCSAAETDASHRSSFGYGIGGFLCGIFGFAIAAVSSPKPPAEALRDKDADDVSAYTRCYESKAKNRNMKAACGGWALGAATTVAILAATGGFESNN